MKILLLNDTRNEENFGCHATVSELLKFLNECFPKSSIRTLSLGTGFNEYASSNLITRSRLLNLADKLVTTINKYVGRPRESGFSSNRINRRLWEKKYDVLLPKNFKWLVDDSDLIVLNAEGTIHHNSVGGVVLLSMALFSINLDKPVAILNGSIQAMSSWLLELVIPRLTVVRVREPCSQDYLRHLGFPCDVVPDFAVRYALKWARDTVEFERKQSSRNCIYSPGVLAGWAQGSAQISFDEVLDDLNEIRKAGFEPSFLQIESNEDDLVQKLKCLGISCIRVSSQSFEGDLGSVFADCALVVTGRFHLGIFSIFKRIPTLFLRTNTFKNIGLLRLLKISNSYFPGALQADDIAKFLANHRPIDIDRRSLVEPYDLLRLEMQNTIIGKHCVETS